MTLELKLKALEIASAKFDGPDMINNAQAIYVWLADSDAPMITAIAKPEIIERRWIPPALTNIQKGVLRKCIEWYIDGTPISGASLARFFKGTNTNYSVHLENLRKKGYIRREGTKIKYTPLYYPDGRKVEAVLVKVPAGAAQGYKPTLGTAAEIRHSK